MRLHTLRSQNIMNIDNLILIQRSIFDIFEPNVWDIGFYSFQYKVGVYEIEVSRTSLLFNT